MFFSYEMEWNDITIIVVWNIDIALSDIYHRTWISSVMVCFVIDYILQKIWHLKWAELLSYHSMLRGFADRSIHFHIILWWTISKHKNHSWFVMVPFQFIKNWFGDVGSECVWVRPVAADALVPMAPGHQQPQVYIYIVRIGCLV